MTSFVFFIIFVYGGIHVYAFMKARQAFGFGWGPGIGVALFMAAMVAAVFLIRTLERHDLELSARTLSYIAYLWMAVLFLFLCSSLFFDLVNLLLRRPHGSSATSFPADTRFSFAASARTIRFTGT
jgi:hypothetical protein